MSRCVATRGKTSQRQRRLRGLFGFETRTGITQQRVSILQVQIPTLLIVRNRAPESPRLVFDLPKSEMGGRISRRELQRSFEVALRIHNTAQCQLVDGQV